MKFFHAVKMVKETQISLAPKGRGFACHFKHNDLVSVTSRCSFPCGSDGLRLKDLTIDRNCEEKMAIALEILEIFAKDDISSVVSFSINNNIKLRLVTTSR